MLDHFRSNPGCPYRDPNECFSEASSIGLSSSSPSPPHSPLSPIASSNEYYDDSPPVASFPQSFPPLYAAVNPFFDFHEEPESYLENDNDLLDIEADPDYPLHAANLILQQDSDLSEDNEDDEDILSNVDDELTSLSIMWTLPTPNNFRPIIEGVQVHPVEEYLLSLLIENHLPKRMYAAIMEWAHYASFLDYDFASALTYQTVLTRMMKKYVHVSGGPPLSEIVRVPGHAPMHVYRFDFLKHVTRLLSDPDLMKDSLWGYNPQVNPNSGERVYAEMNTGDFWKLGEEYVANRLSRLDPSLVDGLPHRLCPVNLFIDSTLVDRIGRLKVEPVLCSIGNISGLKRSSASSWFILGLIPPYPKSSKEAEADRKSVKTQHYQARYYQSCIKSIIQDLLIADKNERGHKMWIPGQGYSWVHFKLSLIIGDTEGHDKICCHYCSYSSNIQRMCRDCDISQSLGDNPLNECNFVNVDEIKDVVSECMPLLEARVRGTVGDAQSRLSAISQLPVWSAFFDFDFCGCPHGIFGSCPFERLHAWQTGLMKNAMEKLFLLSDLPDIFLNWYYDDNSVASSRPRVNITDSQLYINKPKFEAIFRYLTMYSRRQSDREVPRTPFRNGVTDLTRLNGQEYPGLVMLTIVALKGLLHEKVPEDAHKDIIRLFWWMLVLNEMMNEKENTSSMLLLLHERIKEFLILYKKVLGPISSAVSSTGLRKVKFHAPNHAIFYVKHYGSSENFFGGNLESALKSTVKAPTKQTSRRHDQLAKELACRQFVLVWVLAREMGSELVQE